MLERGTRQEALGVQGSLGDAQHHGPCGCRLPPGSHNLLVDVLEDQAIHHLSRQQLGVARLNDVNLARHLADDDFDVLVVDDHTLAAVHLLDLLQEIHLGRFTPQDAEQSRWVDRTFGQLLSGLDL